ncbi:MFS transporter [Lonepinella sp. BR2474]|uniref:MFS transporter n=1 Tax=Lonepinella sp. BR2474 TaxID=3434548 RepID=UPI003F6DE0F1
MSTLNIREWIDDKKLSTHQWILIILCFLVVAIDGMDVAIMGFLAPAITSEWGVSRSEFGIVMGAAPIGLAIGAFFAGSSSDYFGRRKVLLISVLCFAISTILTALTDNVTEMSLWRLITGLGLGAAMPNASTLLSEYIPNKRKGIIMASMFTGFNLGSALIGLIAAHMEPTFGWRSVLYLGGIAPLVLFVVMLFLLPESAKFMVIRNYPVEKIRKVLTKIGNESVAQYQSFVTGDIDMGKKQPIAILFQKEFFLKTIMLWLTYFMGLLVIYLSTGWLPTMLKDAGWSLSEAANTTALFQIGGTIGGVLIGVLLDKCKPAKAIGSTYLLGGICLLSLAAVGLDSFWAVSFICLVGFCLSGAQTGLNAHVPTVYPSVARATGVSSMLAVGRFGSILGSSIGGVLLEQNWGFSGIFTALAVPACLAAVSIFIAGREH